MSVADIGQMLENGKINAFEYYNFFKKRTTQQKVSKHRNCKYTRRIANMPDQSIHRSTLFTVNTTNKSSMKISENKLEPNYSFQARSFMLTNSKDSPELMVEDKANRTKIGDDKFKYQQIKLLSTKHYGSSSNLGRIRPTFCGRIKPSDMRYCSDKNRQNLVNKIIQEEKIKQIRQSLADCELYKDYKEGFDSEDERCIEEELESCLPTIIPFMSSSSSSSMGSSAVDYEFNSIEKSNSAASMDQSITSSNGSVRSNSTQSTDSKRSNDIFLESCSRLFAAPYQLFTLKLSMIEEDIYTISKNLTKTEVEVNLLQDRFKSIDRNLNISEINLKNIYESLQSILQFARGSVSKGMYVLFIYSSNYV
ncbi:hypothetical protein GJ496_005411 [Pomphorhynchus laevis]|nr:hypothetical protein GJ496_005411 [Pomphorhynchus laevis]